MGIIVGIPRLVIAVGLIVSLGFSGARPCVCGDLPAGRGHPSDHGSPKCSCNSAIGHCCCGATCHCLGSLPQQGNQAVLAHPSADWNQPLAFIAKEAVGDSACWPIFAAADRPHFAGWASTLFAQGIRLNC